MNSITFNKIKEEEPIEIFINSEIDDVLHGMLVINLDDYAIIRDKIGREEMEKVLKKIEANFNLLFRGSDIIVKLKGDEFIVLTKNIKELNNVEFLASKILHSVSSVDIGEGVRMTCSIGISIYPFHGVTYDELKSVAYRALFRAKDNGKNCYRLYDAALIKLLYHDYMYDKTSYDKFKDKDLYTIVNNKGLLEACSNMLKDDKDAMSAMNSILELGCLYLGFSRVYYYAPSGVRADVRKKLTYANPGFEYTAESDIMRALREDMQIRISESYNTIALIDADDESVEEEVRLTLHDKDITQILYFPLNSGEIFRGAFIFENLGGDKVKMSFDELALLEEQMRSVQSYFFSSHAKKFAKENLAKLELFENIPASVYIIDAETHVIEFANLRAKEHVDGGHIGELCYHAFANKNVPCKNCPLTNMDPDDDHANGMFEYYNYATREWTKNLYSWMGIYDNRNKVIMISVDVSDYVSDMDKVAKLMLGDDFKDL